MGVTKMRNMAIIYHYFEVDEIYRDNLTFFLNTAISPNVDYYFLISGNCSLKFPDQDNIKIIHIENKNHDFGGAVEFVKRFGDLPYEFYFFVNSSVRGPFVPTYFTKPWHAAFTERLSSEVKMVGSSINLLPARSEMSLHFEKKFGYGPPHIHVQTTAYAISSDAFAHLCKIGLFDVNERLEKKDVIAGYELRMSQEILARGWSISALLPLYEGFNSEKRVLLYHGVLKDGDPLYKNAFFDRNISPLETMFIKTNRNMISPSDLASYTFTSLAVSERHGGLGDSGKSLLERSYRKILMSNLDRDPKRRKIKRFFKK